MRNEALSWACRYDYDDCVADSLRLFEQWMAQPESEVLPTDLKKTVTCVAVRKIGEPAWEFAKSQLQMAILQSEKLDLLAGMACSTNATLLST